MIFINNKNKKYIYGLDLSMSNSGIAIFDLNTFKPVLITSISTNAKNEHGKRLHTQREYTKKIIKKYPPYEVAIERGFSRFNKATQTIFKVHGIYNELFHNQKQFYYRPNTIKKVVGGHGHATKQKIQAKILRRYPDIKFNNDDESDAFAVAVCHLIKKHDMKW